MFRMPPITKNLLIINVLIYFASWVLRSKGIDLNGLFGLHFFMSSSFQPYQLLTYMFLHSGAEHLFFNMLAFWMFGRIMEQVWGPKKYLIFYLVCGVGAGLCQELVQYFEYMSEGLANYNVVTNGSMTMPMDQYLSLWTTVGASGAVYGILLGFGMTFPNERVLLLIPPIPIKAKYLVIGYAVIELFSAFNTNSNVAHFAHLGGMLFGLGLILYWRKKAREARSGFTSWQEYSPKESFADRLKRMFKRSTTSNRSSNWSRANHSSSDTTAPKQEPSSNTATADPLAQRRAQQAEVDRILNKVKTSGYGCLTEEEKKTIFDFRNRR